MYAANRFKFKYKKIKIFRFMCLITHNAFFEKFTIEYHSKVIY